ncbi:MAG: sugar ABC transporter permease [Lachnospiraceae bacterium]|jgi:multiple sugar transport system permease protein|nr:sugar ABC transporter permease [uncultured Acetatifactor sp.]MCI9219139.1 sugar ABC transporter permease [Lachnospiraceae bacterium]
MKKRRFRVNAAVWFLLPYLLMFVTFIVIPVLAAMVLSFTNYDAVQTPKPAGFLNYINLLTQDEIFMQYVLPNTCVFAFIVGPVGYMLSFLLAWMLAQISKVPRTILALLIYSPSMTSGVAMAVVWKIIFAGDQMGYVNSLLMNLGITNQPILFTSDARFLLPIMIVVSLWSSMGVGFLAILAGILNINPEYYEAAAIDGIRNRFQEIFYITIPQMKPQMMFAAVMAVVNTFSAGAIGVQLSGSNPTPAYAGQLIVNHIEDYGFIRYEMGYASAISVVLLAGVYTISRVAGRVFRED